MLALMPDPNPNRLDAPGSGLVAMGVRYVQLLAEKCWRERRLGWGWGWGWG